MKLKKKVKRLLIILLIIILVVAGVAAYKVYFHKEEIKEVKILNTIDKYEYHLKDNKSKEYENMFHELEKILSKESVNEEDYAKKIAEMFIYDFYSLNDKTAKTDVGGVDFVHPSILENFLQNAENTFYKYVESNIYNNRNQQLPTVGEITIDNVENITYGYNNITDEKAYQIKVSWTYTDETTYSDYQKEATLVFVHEDVKLYLVELQ